MDFKTRVPFINTFVDHALNYISVHPVRLQIVTLPIGPMKKDPVFDTDMKEEEVDSILDLFEIEGVEVTDDWIVFDWDWIVLPAIQKLTVFTEDVVFQGGILDVPREDFTWTVESKKEGISLRQLVEAVYRLKGNKYDNPKQVFFGLNISSNENSHLVLEAHFDY